ncbi:hypothetical protein [Streptomyces flavalbus]|uniref:Secreted protein n=1 Tax=Streptomyces flavalbus TaxID=2665155 RepID=A0ABW2WED0_9ACTN
MSEVGETNEASEDSGANEASEVSVANEASEVSVANEASGANEVPEVPEVSEVPEVPEAPPPRRSGRRIAAVVAAVLVVGAVVAGTGYTVVTVRDADRDAGAPVWRFPKTTADKAEARASGLADMLVPFDDTEWARGPDIGHFGSDASLNGDRALELRKESLRDLPRSERRELERHLERQEIQGLAMRSYQRTPWGVTDRDHAVTVSVELVRMDRRAARSGAATVREFVDVLDVFRKGPEIKGHKDAYCYLPPKEADVELDAMFCTAVQGDVLVTATAYGVKPLDTEAVAELLREQLDRVDGPGEAV